MLIACDIDGTIATNGNYYCRVMAEQAGIMLPEEELAGMTYGVAFWDHPQVKGLPGRATAAPSQARARWPAV